MVAACGTRRVVPCAKRARVDVRRGAGKYVSDFADPYLHNHPKHLVIPHLGASTEEAEDNSAALVGARAQWEQRPQ
jgi:hypothetical protein